jgi:sn-glycerol 3-phosphate transport system ATP-binding protein
MRQDTSGQVIVGIRPEDIVPDSTGPITVEVDIVEELGAHRLLHGRLGGQPVSVHVSKDSPVTTGPLHVALKPDAVSLFDLQTGDRL